MAKPRFCKMRCIIFKKTFDPARTRTWNPLILSQMPYPLGHRAAHVMCQAPSDFENDTLRSAITQLLQCEIKSSRIVRSP